MSSGYTGRGAKDGGINIGVNNTVVQEGWATAEEKPRQPDIATWVIHIQEEETDQDLIYQVKYRYRGDHLASATPLIQLLGQMKQSPLHITVTGTKAAYKEGVPGSGRLVKVHYIATQQGLEYVINERLHASVLRER